MSYLVFLPSHAHSGEGTSSAKDFFGVEVVDRTRSRQRQDSFRVVSAVPCRSCTSHILIVKGRVAARQVPNRVRGGHCVQGYRFQNLHHFVPSSISIRSPQPCSFPPITTYYYQSEHPFDDSRPTSTPSLHQHTRRVRPHCRPIPKRDSNCPTKSRQHAAAVIAPRHKSRAKASRGAQPLPRASNHRRPLSTDDTTIQ